MKPSRTPAIRPIEDAREYAFEQWVRLWLRERIAALGSASSDGILSLLEDGIRPESSGSFSFPPQDIAGADASDGEAVRLRLHFLGLTGASSPLPSFLVEDLARQRENSPALRDFLHLFERRVYRLYAWVVLQRKIWARAEFAASDLMTAKLSAWAGEGGADRNPEPGRRLRGLELLGASVRSARGLRRYFSMQLSESRIEVDDRGVQWFANPAPARLGTSKLGGDAAIGERVGLAGEAVEIRIGPLPWSRFQEYAHDRPDTQERMAGLMDDYLERPRAWRVVFELDSETAPKETTILGVNMRLGRHAWIGTSTRQKASLVIASAATGGT